MRSSRASQRMRASAGKRCTGLGTLGTLRPNAKGSLTCVGTLRVRPRRRPRTPVGDCLLRDKESKAETNESRATRSISLCHAASLPPCLSGFL